MFRRISLAYVFATSLVLLTTGDAQTVSLSGLSKPAKVSRDARSIPYISAANNADLYFVQGYVTASDRLWQMDLMRRLPRGETAEIFGKQTLEEDKRWRRMGFSKVVDESLVHLSPELREALESYAKGVNAYISSLTPETLPVEFKILQYRPRPWTPSDSLIIGKILADALSSTWRTDLTKASLMASLPRDKFDDLAKVQTDQDVIVFGTDRTGTRAFLPATGRPLHTHGKVALAAAETLEGLRESSLARVGFYAEQLAASNNWVISGKRTADGKPILANDPHLQPTAPGIWYLTHLEAPGMRVAGVTFPGVPGIVLGHNDHIAWGATNVGPDVQDLFVETFDEAGRVKTAAGWEAPLTRKESINVRSNPLKADTETVTIEVVETRNGPIILEEGVKRYALKWTARDPKNNDFAAFFLINRAKDWKEFRAALATYRGATQNFVYADTKGNIGWQIAGGIPNRRTGDGSLPYDGASTDGEWIGLVPLDELPNLYNPASGLIVTANQRIVGSDHRHSPVIVREFAPPWRARRLFDLLNADRKVTMDAVAAAQHDSYNIPLAELSKQIVKAGAASEPTLALFRSWDGRMRPDSTAALVANEIRNCLAGKMAEENRPAPVAAIRERVLFWAIRDRSARWLPKAYADYPAFLRACDAESTAALEKRYGTDRAVWTWAKVSVSRFPHPLAVAPLIGGQFATPVVGIEGSGQTPNVASGVSMRFIASPGNWDATRHVIPLGQSGDPKSPNFKDQFEAWRTGNSTVFPFTPPAVEKAAVSRVEFWPAR